LPSRLRGAPGPPSDTWDGRSEETAPQGAPPAARRVRQLVAGGPCRGQPVIDRRWRGSDNQATGFLSRPSSCDPIVLTRGPQATEGEHGIEVHGPKVRSSAGRSGRT